ncbi:hypothetical protein AMS59_02270 [Lysinibacillus sp. FJAT-14745]|uniref:hypothetical protein n=1 Tax=Lysinibacillus sp. FJAT-14745 TaxID=1704289 RepID=UPI0006ABC187|nr:hypothetical protein [Lysinibacillus sp. FJAT-14745]KOP80243.1 hypothetical protein AMS59_02270 [Lysinibacillus sp. FJAT-14745]
MTWFYPYSPFSVKKSYEYHPGKVLYGGKSYEAILNEFKESYNKDLKADLDNKYPNLTINRTQYVLPIFEQDWLISKDSIPFDVMKLDRMLLDVKQVREVLLELVVQADYTSEERGYLVNNIETLLSLEDSITQLKNENYLSRRELKIQFHNLCEEFKHNFDLFVTFYERSQY